MSREIMGRLCQDGSALMEIVPELALDDCGPTKSHPELRGVPEME